MSSSESNVVKVIETDTELIAYEGITNMKDK